MAFVVKEYKLGEKVLIGSYEKESDANNKVNELLDAGAEGVYIEVSE
jgi:macrodomain Ter protein organizer (MatP/YcbG family)